MDLRPKDRDKTARLEARLWEALPQEEWEVFDPLLRLEARIAQELTLGEALRERDARMLTMTLARVAIKCADKSPTIVKLTQATDGKLMGSLGRWLVHRSRPSFGSKIATDSDPSAEAT